MPNPFARRRRTAAPTRTPVARAARAACDRLEPRRMLATYTGNGTSGNDSIELVYNVTLGVASVQVRVTPQGGATYTAATAFVNDDLVVNGLGGSDTISVNGGQLVGQSVTVNGGQGDDVLQAFNLWLFDADEPLTLNGDAGSDRVRLSDVGSTYVTDHTLTATTYDSVRESTVYPEFPLLTYGTAEALTLNTDANGPSDVFVPSASVPVTVTGGSADDRFTVGTAPASSAGVFLPVLDYVVAPLTLDGAAGTDALRITDSANPTDHTHTFNATTYDRGGAFASLAHAGVDDVRLEAGSGADAIFVTGTAAANNQIFAGNGNDAFVVGRTANVIDGNLNEVNGFLRLHGEAGYDTLLFDDEANTSAYVHTLTGTRYDRTEPDSQGIEYATFEAMSLHTSDVADDVWVRSTSIQTGIDLGGGADRAYVGATPGQLTTLSSLTGIAANLAFFGGSDSASDSLSVRDRAGAGGTHTLTLNTYDKSGAFPQLTYSQFETAGLQTADAGADAVFVPSTAAGTSTTVDTGGGAAADIVVLGKLPGVVDGNLDPIDGPLTVLDSGGAGATDRLVVDDEANPAGHTHALGVFLPNLVTGFRSTYDRSGGFAALDHAGFDDVVIYASDAGDDLFFAPYVLAPTRLVGNGGGDGFFLGRNESGSVADMGGLDAPVTVDGGLGTDGTFLNNFTAAGDQTHTLTATTYSRTGGVGTVTYGETEETILTGSNVAADTFVVNGTPASHRVFAYGNAGHDALTVNASSPLGVDFDGGSGAEVVSLPSNASAGHASLYAADDLYSLSVGDNKRLSLRGDFGRYAVRTGSLGVHGTGRVELNRHGVVIDTSTTAIPTFSAELRADIVAARSGGTWLGQAGITTANPNDGVAQPANTSVGYVLPTANGTFMGQPHDAGSILIRATLNGDLNLDGTVNFADQAVLSANYGQSQPRWDRGDLNYDGVVSFADQAALSANYGATLPAAPLPSPSPFSDVTVAEDVLA